LKRFFRLSFNLSVFSLLEIDSFSSISSDISSIKLDGNNGLVHSQAGKLIYKLFSALVDATKNNLLSSSNFVSFETETHCQTKLLGNLSLAGTVL
jgi:hypothetical protein